MNHISPCFIFLTGESKMVLAARQLMHTCWIYEDSLMSLHSELLNQIKISKSSTQAKPPARLVKAFEQVKEQIQLDTVLLQKILNETNKVTQATNKTEFIRNVITSEITGRANTFKSLEFALMNRVQLITAFMMKEVWRVR
jgi:hypothetical protein